MSIPVLSYHAVNVTANHYAANDHVALAEDLRTLHDAGFRVIPLGRVLDWHQGRLDAAALHRAVAITFDDGSWFDYYDLEHPVCGLQRGMLGILEDFRDEVGTGAQPHLHASSFVIASPRAREELDRKGLVGKGWWGDEWWPQAARGGLLGIECHSWDHNHPDLETVAQREQRKGSFQVIDSYEDCHVQVAEAGDYIQSRLGGARPAFFAYPWGEASDYIVEHYFPEHRHRHGFSAAFTTDPRPVTRADDRWRLPRFVCGRDWHSTGELARLIDG